MSPFWHTATAELLGRLADLSSLTIAEQDRAVKLDANSGFRTRYHDTHPDAPLSPLYLNLRTTDNPKPGPLTKSDVNLAADIFDNMIGQLGLERAPVAGIPNAGTPFAAALTKRAGAAHLRITKEELVTADEAEAPPTEAMFRSTSQLIILDDVLSEADTKIKMIKWARQHGYRPTILVLCDRLQGGREVIAPFASIYSAFDIVDLCDAFVARGLINERGRLAALSYPTLLRHYQASLL